MPVEVKELVIRGVVVENDSDNGSTAESQEALVKACVNQMLKIAKRKQRR